MKNVAFDAKVISSARKKYVCFACGRTLEKGAAYIGYPGTDHDGNFKTIRFCIECSYLLTQKSGANASTIRQNEFSDILIPNCLRKKRKEFRENPKAAIHNAGLDQATPFHQASPVSRLVVKKSEFERRIFHLTETDIVTKERFQRGNNLTIKAGVAGESREVKILGSWSVAGSGFGVPERQIAILTRPV